MRPKDKVKSPKLFVHGSNRLDVVQGQLGDCWLMASIAALTVCDDEVFDMVVPKDQGFGDTYAGVFHFRFWQFGRWVDVVVDDRLFYYPGDFSFLGNFDNPVFSRPNGNSEFWVPLLEKAYAKLHGSYDVLDGGYPNEALEDFTGGISRSYPLDSESMSKNELFNQIFLAYNKKWPMVCATQNVKEASQLAGTHAYAVTRVEYVAYKDPEIPKAPLVRLYNPNGPNAKYEWNGDWSDSSDKWEDISDSEKDRICFVNKHDSEFWISIDDLTKNFAYVCICSLSQECPSASSLPTCTNSPWYSASLRGQWNRWTTAGGCKEYDSYDFNPKYKIKLFEKGQEQKDSQMCSVILALMQDRRKSQRIFSRSWYRLSMDLNKFDEDDSIDTNPGPLGDKQREISVDISLQAGEYVIVPHTKFPHQGCEFLLRVFADTEVTIEIIPTEEKHSQNSLGYVPPPSVESFLKSGGIRLMDLKDIIDGSFMGDPSIWKWYLMKFNYGLPKDVCCSLLAAFDNDHTAKLSLNEFKDLWIDLQHWKEIFVKFSQSHQGVLSLDELKEALASTYLKIPTAELSSILFNRYAYGKYISFSAFLICAVKFMKIIDV